MKRSKHGALKAIAVAVAMTATSITLGMAGSARAEVVARYDADQWLVEANASDGAFQNCTVTADYGRGAKVMFMLTREGNWGIGIVNPSFNLNAGMTGQVAYWIDDGRARSGKAKALSAKSLMVMLAASEQLFDEIRSGSRMYLKVGDETFNLTLNGTNTALAALVGCARRHQQNARASN